MILHEPMILRRFGDGRERRIVKTLSALGNDVSGIAEVTPGKVAATWFDSEILPVLQRYDYWGIKEVYLTDAMDLIDRYRPDQLVLLWRDPRDVALSFLELMNAALMSYSDRTTLKDEAWALECLVDSAERLHAISDDQPHFLLNYELLMTSAQTREALLATLGFSAFGNRAIAMVKDAEGVRSDEVDRHAETWSARSVNRWQQEPDGWRKTFANVCWSAMQPYASNAGYPGDSSLARIARATPTASASVRVSDPAYEPHVGFDFAFSKRRGRKRIAPCLTAKDRVLDVGGTTAALVFMTPAKVTVVDDGKSGKQLLSRAWKEGVFPNLESFDICTFIASLEFVDDPMRMLWELLRRGKRILVTYHCSDDLLQEKRESLGFQSAISRAQWQSFAADTGSEIQTDWVFDDFQSMIDLRPNDSH